MVSRGDDEDFSYASLVNRWRRERASTSLTKIGETFYETFDAVLKKLHEDYHREHAINPAAPKVLILLDELTNLQRIRDDLYDLRERKVVTASVIAARDGKPDPSHMTRGERLMFDSVLRVLREGRATLLRAQAPAPEPPARPKAGPPLALEPAPTTMAAAQPVAPLVERGRGAEAAPESTLPVEEPERRVVGVGRVLVRVKEDVEPFVAPDLRHYHLRAQDVAALPRDVAHLLITRGFAAALGG